MEILKNDTNEQAINGLPLISVVTVCYNAAATIEETIQSVLGQTYPNVEYIIIDGGSTDGTVDIIKRYADSLAYWVSEPDKGIYDAMNKGIAIATGDYINFMNAGDKFHNDNVLQNFAPNIEYASDIAYGDFRKMLKKYNYRVKPLSLDGLSRGMVFCHQSTFIKTSYHKKHQFDVTFKSSGDYKFFYEAYFKFHAKFQYIPIEVSDFDSTVGMSKDNIWLVYKEDLMIRNESDSITKRLVALYQRAKRTILHMLPVWLVAKIKRDY